MKKIAFSQDFVHLFMRFKVPRRHKKRPAPQNAAQAGDAFSFSIF
jgi:hypothetical protein